MKRLIVIGAVMLMVGGMVSMVRAGSSDTMTLTVTATSPIDVTIYATTYSFGTVALNSTSISVTSTAVKNTSGTSIETYNLKVSADGTGWTIADSTGGDSKVRIQAIWNTAKPTDAEIIDSANYNLNTAGKTCDGTLFGGTATYDGHNVSPTTSPEENLWFKLWTPQQSGDIAGVKTFYLTITASMGG
jgi:hypothetical protein